MIYHPQSLPVKSPKAKLPLTCLIASSISLPQIAATVSRVQPINTVIPALFLAAARATPSVLLRRAAFPSAVLSTRQAGRVGYFASATEATNRGSSCRTLTLKSR